MKHEMLTEILSTLQASAAHRTDECPDDHALAAVADGSLNPEVYQQVRRHMADCDFCVRQLGLLSRLRGEEPEQNVPELLLARAGRLAIARKSQPLANVAGWAAAAVVVLAVSLTFFWNSPDPVSPGTPGTNVPIQESSGQEQIRNFGPRVSTPEILSPAEGARMALGTQVIRWSEAPGSLYYDVRVVTDDGKLVWTERLEATQVSLPESLGLESGADYFVRVDAYLTEARKLSSRHVLFTVGEER